MTMISIFPCELAAKRRKEIEEEKRQEKLRLEAEAEKKEILFIEKYLPILCQKINEDLEKFGYSHTEFSKRNRAESDIRVLNYADDSLCGDFDHRHKFMVELLNVIKTFYSEAGYVVNIYEYSESYWKSFSLTIRV